MAKRQSTNAADAAQTDAARIAADAQTPALPAPAPIESEATMPVELSPEASAVLALTSALAALPEGNPARAALEAALTDARGAQALAEAEAARQRQKAEEQSAALAAAAAANLPDAIVDAMLAAIDARYAPAPEATPEADAADAPAPYVGRKPIGPAAQERNAAAAATLAADDSFAARVDATIAAFDAGDLPKLAGVQRMAGTRYASIVPFASGGAGVANAADYRTLASAIRLRLLRAPHNLKSNGESVASVPWLSATGPHAPNGPKGSDTLRLKFSDFRAIALYPDGMFRLAVPNTAGVRFLHSDAAALALFNGATNSVQTRLADAPAVDGQHTLDAALATAKTPAAPTPPNAIALPTGGLARTARCQHCQRRNIVGSAACEQCKAEDWYAA